MKRLDRLSDLEWVFVILSTVPLACAALLIFLWTIGVSQ